VLLAPQNRAFPTDSYVGSSSFVRCFSFSCDLFLLPHDRDDSSFQRQPTTEPPLPSHEPARINNLFYCIIELPSKKQKVKEVQTGIG
jgi:hypothetical protein